MCERWVCEAQNDFVNIYLYLYIQDVFYYIWPIGNIEMTTPPITRSSRLLYKRPKQEEVTDFSDNSKLIVICFSEHVETFKNN